jgi:hypothetical protein
VDTITVLGRDQGADLRLGLERVADLELAGRVREL